MYLTHRSRAGSVEGFGDRDGRRGARGTEDHREVRGIGDSSESLVGSDPGDIAGKQQPRTCRADAAPHDGRRPGRGQEGAGCQRRFPGITARSMECSSEPGVIVAGAGALPRARRRCEAGKRTHGPGPRACLALLAATALLALAAPAQAQTTTVTQSGDGATWSLVGENTVAAGQQTYTYTLTRTSGSLPLNEYFGFTSDILEAERFQDGYSDCTGTNYFCFTLSNSYSYSEYTSSNVRFAGRILTDTSPHVLTLKVATGTPAGTTVTLGVVRRSGVPRSGGLQITVGTAPTNTAPTAANKTVTTGEDRAYAFTADDFGFDDDDAGATLASVTIVTLPMVGTLALDGTAVLADDDVTTAQIDADMLTFTPARDAHGDPYTTFTFTVNDGTDDSGSAYTMTIDVTDAPAPVCGVPDIAGAGRRQIWTSTVTVERGESSGTVYYGFIEGVEGTLLPSQSFSIGSNNYVIDAILVGVNGTMEFSIGGFDEMTFREVAALRLNVCDGDYDFGTADNSFDVNTTTWFRTTLDWSPPVVTRTVYLSLPANNDATGEPAISGTAQAGQALTADASPLMDADGLPSSFTYKWFRVDSDGTSNEAEISGETAATYTLTAADAGKKVKVKVSFTDELSGEEERTSAAYPSSGTVTTAANTTAPALLSVTVTSTPRKTTDTYGAREHIEFSMTFDAPVTVTGAPTFAFDLGGPSTATWYAGSGTTTLRFSHAVSGGSSGDRDTNGISWAENAIALNGGTIAGRDNAVAAVLTHAAQSNLAAHKVDGRTTAVTPATVTVAVTSTPTSLADTYGFGETIVITVTVSEAVEVEGDPVFRFSLTDMGGAANDVPATYDRTRSSATTMVFAYTVQAGDMDNNGIWIGDHSRTFMLDVNDRIRTASQQIDIDRSHPEKSTHADHKVNGSLGAPTVPPDPTAPTLVSATATTLTIEWTHPGDGGSPLTRNFIEYRVEGTTDWTNWYRGETPTPVTRTVITNLAAGTAYDVRVHSTNAIGNSQWTQSATAFSTLAGTAATGAPTITGTAAVGQPLAVDLTGIEDADGLTNVSYSYQWVRVDADGLSNPADITDATDATYTVVYADLGKTLKVRVTFDDDGGNTETLTSAATATVTPAAGTPGSPTNLSATVGVGQVVLVWERPDSRAEWSHYEYRSSPGEMIAPDAMWQQALSSPGSLNTAYYQLVKGLTSGTTHTFQVRAVNTRGGSAPATVTVTPISQPSCTIDELGDRRLLWQGQLVAGIREIHVDGSIDTGYGRGGGDGTLTPDAFTFRSTSYSVYPRTYEDFLYVLMREQNIDGWYPREEVVDALRVHVCNTPYDFGDATAPDFFSSFGGYRWNVGFNWPAGIERTLRLSLPPNHAATGDPVISGTVQVGEELTALTDGIMDDDVLDDVFTYQWVRVDADGTSNEEDITDETDATYTLTADERGKKVKVEVRFVDILGGEETRTSAPTATLAGVPNTAATGAPTITGTAEVGQTLTASTTGIADANGLTSPTYTYQWIRVDGTEADIASENSSTYPLVDADLGKTLKVRVTFADDLGHTETLTSAATATVGAVATGPPTVNDVAVTSTPASGTTYYLAGEVIEFTVTFSAPVTVTATPKFAFRLGAATRQAAYASGSGSAALVFARTVQAGEVDRNGISWNAIALALDGGTITQTGATTAASLTHAEQAPLEGHRVDAAPPMQVSASVQGMSLVLVYDEPLDPASMPATGAYTVTATVGATTTNPAVSEVSIYGIWVTLALDAAPAAGATVTLAYAPPASNPVQDEAGNDAPAFSGQSVRLGPPPPPPPPVTDLAQVMGVGVVPGNAQLVVTWTAVSTATGYTVQWTSSGQGYNIGDRQATVTSGSTTRYTIPSLTNGTEYTVRVIATRTGADDGPPSDEMTGTPRVPPPPPPPVTDLAQVLGVGVVTGQRAAGGDLDGGVHRHGLHGAVDVERTGLQHRRPAGHGHDGVDHALHDSQPHQRHGIHGAGDRDPNRRRRRPALGRDDGDAESAAAATAAGDGPCAGAGGGGRTGQRAAGGDLDGGGQRHGLHGAVDVERTGLQHRRPAGHGHDGVDHALHDSQPHQRHGIHGAGDRDPDGRHRRRAVGGGDGDALHHARRAAAPAGGAGRRTGDADLGCPVERRRFRDPPLRVCDRRQRDLDRRGPRSGGNGAGPDERPAVRVRGAGGEQRRPRCAGEDGGHAARHAECARVAHGHWGRRRGRPGVDRARGRWRLACDGLRVPLRRRPGCAGRRHLAGRGHRAHGDGLGAGERDALHVRGAGAEPCGPRGDIGDDGPAASVAGGAVQHGCARGGRRGARGWGAPEREARVSGPRLHRRDGQRVAWRDGNGRGARRRARPPPSGVRGWRSRGDSDGHGGLRRRASAGPGAERDARFRGTGGRRRKAAL